MPRGSESALRTRFFKRRVLLPFLCTGLFFLFVGIGVATIRAAVRVGGYWYIADCGAPQPYLKPSSADQALFTAQVFYVGRVDSEYAMQSGHRFGPWALAHVKHRYWGLPWWSSMVVALGPGWYQQGESYLVDGTWPGASKFLPVVVTGPCRRTRPLSDAIVDTRVLAAAKSSSAVRVIGRTYRRRSPTEFELAPGMRLQINGPNGAVFVTSDAEAVYDITGLPAGHYGIQIEQPDRRNREEGDQERDLSTGEVWVRDLYSR